MNRNELDRHLAEATPAEPELAEAVRDALLARQIWLASKDGQAYTEAKAISREVVRKLLPFVHYTDEELEL